MPRTALTKTTAPGNYAAAGVAVTMTAADVANLNSFVANGNDLVIAENTGATPYTITITSAPDPYGRTADIATESIAAGAIRIYGPFPLAGWQQSDGSIYLQASNVAVKFGVVKLPG